MARATAAWRALLASPEGAGHTAAATTNLYDTYFGRDPTVQELGVWSALISGGDDFNQLRDTLERQSTAGSVQHVVGTGGAQTFVFGASTNLTIDAFDTGADAIDLSSAKFGGINPLDAAHALQIPALDGTTDVLVTLDATHSILIEHTTLASLHASDFVFG